MTVAASVPRVDATHYTYRVRWHAPDGQHLATVAEFPGLSCLEDSPGEALEGLIGVVEAVLDDMASSNEEVPVPLSDRKFSGKFQVRIPEDLHRSLAIAAAEQGISINRLASDRLARG